MEIGDRGKAGAKNKPLFNHNNCSQNVHEQQFVVHPPILENIADDYACELFLKHHKRIEILIKMMPC